MKRIYTCFLLLFCLTALLLPVSADENPFETQPPRLVDNAGLLDDSEFGQLNRMLDEISLRQACDIVIVTVNSLGGASAMDYADDYYDYNGYGQGAGDDGLLLLVDMGDRQWHITTHGWALTAFTDFGLSYLEDRFLDDLSNGYYYDAFVTFAEECDTLMNMARDGSPLDIGSDSRPDGFPTHLILPSLGIGLVCALIGTSSMKAQLKTVRQQSNANSYVKGSSLHLTDSRDTFLYRTVSRRERPRDNGGGGSSSHRSSSGRSHGGRGGRF